MTWQMWRQAHCRLVLMGGCGSSAGRHLWRLEVEEWWEGVVVVGLLCGVLAVAVTMFTHVVTATPRSVLID